MQYVGDIVRAKYVGKHLLEGKGKCLDAGCGANLYTGLVEGKGYQWYGIDVNSIPPAVYGSVTEIPFEDEFFDVVLCVDVLEHVGKDFVAVKEMFRVLKPGGVLVLHTPNSCQTHILADFPDNPAHVRKGYTDFELTTLLEQAGFCKAEVHPTFNVLEAILWELWNLLRIDMAMLERLANFELDNYKNLGWLCVSRKDTNG